MARFSRCRSALLSANRLQLVDAPDARDRWVTETLLAQWTGDRPASVQRLGIGRSEAQRKRENCSLGGLELTGDRSIAFCHVYRVALFQRALDSFQGTLGFERVIRRP